MKRTQILSMMSANVHIVHDFDQKNTPNTNSFSEDHQQKFGKFLFSKIEQITISLELKYLLGALKPNFNKIKVIV